MHGQAACIQLLLLQIRNCSQLMDFYFIAIFAKELFSRSTSAPYTTPPSSSFTKQLGAFSSQHEHKKSQHAFQTFWMWNNQAQFTEAILSASIHHHWGNNREGKIMLRKRRLLWIAWIQCQNALNCLAHWTYQVFSYKAVTTGHVSLLLFKYTLTMIEVSSC